VEKKIVSLLYNKEKASNAFFGTNVNKSVYLFVYGFRLTFVLFMDGDLPKDILRRIIYWRADDHTSLNHTFVTSPEIFDFHCGATMTNSKIK
jgi:hypothetical protein